MSRRILIEVCVASLAGAIAAERAGADRIELNYGLELDGLTPGAGLLELVRQHVRIPIIAMARPRGGDFYYTDHEWNTLVHDAQWLLEHGAHGIAFGCLTQSGQVDAARCGQMRSLAGSHELVFHKAFDEVPDWQSGLESLIDAGVNRVMTSGQEPTALEGVSTVSQIQTRAASRIEVLPAGRIGAKNAAEIVDLTGVSQIHGSFSTGPGGDVAQEISLTLKSLGSLIN